MPIVLNEEPGAVFEALGDEECFELIRGSRLGRVAIALGAVPAIFPVNYVAVDDAIYFATSRGTKLAAATRGATVAFEIDHFDFRYHQGWSVLAVGPCREVLDQESLRFVRGLPILPWAPGVRGHFVQLRPDFVSGRRVAFPHADEIAAEAGWRPDAQT